MKPAIIHSGVVFSQSILSEPWFLLLTLVVALNTIIYLGLTFAKLAPWPAHEKQEHAPF